MKIAIAHELKKKCFVDRCNGNTTCNFKLTPDWMQEDPCPGYLKYLEASYICVQGKILTLRKIAILMSKNGQKLDI